MKMKYKNLEFLKNPATVELKSEAGVAVTPLLSRASKVDSVYEKPTVICAGGVVCGEEGEEWCSRMKHYLKDPESGWLFTVSAPPIKAFLTSFSFRRSSKSDEITYNAEFCEDCSEKGFDANIKYTYARAGENAFDIAYRCNIPVDRLEELNGFVSPFEINENDRVIIR